MKGTCPYTILHKKLFELQHLLHYSLCKTDTEIQQINGRITEEIPAKFGFLKTLLGIEMESHGSDKAHLQQIADWLSAIEAWSNAQPKDGVFAALPFCSVCAKDDGGVSDSCLCSDSCFEEEEEISNGVSNGGRDDKKVVSDCERKEGRGRKVGSNRGSIFFRILVAVVATVVGIVTICSMEAEEEVKLLPS